jgi:hypothetical protein
MPTVNTNLAGFGFGAMYPSWLWYLGTSTRPSTKSAGLLEERIGRDV